MKHPAKRTQVVLIGGGHTNALVARMLAMNPLSGTEITMVADNTFTPYSGMIPGYLAGYYDIRQAHIDLDHLCNWAGIKLIQASVTDVDPQNKLIFCQDRPEIPYDIASINIGSRPHIAVKGSEHTVGVKPIPGLLKRVDEMVPQSGQIAITIIGGGPSGVESALALVRRFGATAAITLVYNSNQVLPAMPAASRRIMEQLLRKQGISLIANATILEIQPNRLVTSKLPVEFDICIDATNARPHPWLTRSRLPLGDQGFIKVDQNLEVAGCKGLFAAGDTITFAAAKLEKSGVHAVRQGKVMANNMRARLDNQPLQPYRPQETTLSLIGTPGEPVLLTKGRLTFAAKGLWHFKEWIDQRFMKQFLTTQKQMLPAQNNPPTNRPRAEIYCKGCAAKVSGTAMKAIIETLKSDYRCASFNPLDLMDFNGDASQITLSDQGQPQYITVDHISALIEDEFLFGQIATLHSLSDIYAVGAKPRFVTLNLSVLRQHPKQAQQAIVATMRGILKALATAQCHLVAAHTSFAEEATIGLTVIGTSQDQKPKAPPLAGQKIIVTKPLGIGAILASKMTAQHLFNTHYFRPALETMLISNRRAAEIFGQYGAATKDVTGFGLGGHLIEMLEPHGLSCILDPTNIPLLRGFSELIGQDCRSSSHDQNQELIAPFIEFRHNRQSELIAAVLADPQTSGGLLAAVDSSIADSVVNELKESEYGDAKVIGTLIPRKDNGPVIFIE